MRYDCDCGCDNYIEIEGDLIEFSDNDDHPSIFGKIEEVTLLFETYKDLSNNFDTYTATLYKERRISVMLTKEQYLTIKSLQDIRVGDQNFSDDEYWV